MRIHTIEAEFEYQMKNIIKQFKKGFELEELTAEEFQEKVWEDAYLAREFGKAVLQACNEYSGDELFE